MTAQGGGSLAEQLASALPRLHGARAPAPRRPACRVTLHVPADDLDGAFGEVRNEVLRWMQDRAGRRLPAEAWRGEGFELAGAAPLRAETAPARDGSRVFGSVDVEHGFSRETVMRVSEVALSSQSEATRARFEVGGSVEWGGGRYALQGAARWATGARDYGGGLTLNVRF